MIERRGRYKRIEFTREQRARMVFLYQTREQSMPAIAEAFGVGSVVVRRVLLEEGVKPRTKSEARKLQPPPRTLEPIYDEGQQAITNRCCGSLRSISPCFCRQPVSVIPRLRVVA